MSDYLCRGSDDDEDDDDDDDDEGEGEAQSLSVKVKWPNWLPQKYRQLWKWGGKEKHDFDEGVLEVGLDTPEMETLEMCLDTTLVSDTFMLNSQHQKSIAINVPKIKSYERVVTSRPVTFTCQYCGEILTQLRMPGPLPTYCSDRCRLDAAATRKKAVRAETGKNQGKRGRPKKDASTQ